MRSLWFTFQEAQVKSYLCDLLFPVISICSQENFNYVKCVRMRVCVCVCGLHVYCWCCGGQRTTSVVSLHLAPSSLLFTVALDRLAEVGFWKFLCLYFPFHCRGMLGLQMCMLLYSFFVSIFSHVGAGGLNSGSQDHTAKAICWTPPFPPPLLYLFLVCSFFWGRASCSPEVLKHM